MGMSYVDNIIAKLGGTRKASAITGFPSSTIHSWKVAGSIPDRHKPTVAEKARAAGVDLGPADFFPSIAEGEAA
jgi:hypothetical protein